VVHRYFENLKKLSEYFLPPPAEEKPEVTLGLEDDRFAYDFKFRLPLVKGMKFDK
jgi:type IV pilus assembly protein PilM